MLEPDCRYHMDAAGEMPYKAETEREREGLDRKVAWRMGEIVGRWGKSIGVIRPLGGCRAAGG